MLQSFEVDSEGGLTLVDTVMSGGNGPTFAGVLSTGEVTAMNVSLLFRAATVLRLTESNNSSDRPIAP